MEMDSHHHTLSYIDFRGGCFELTEVADCSRFAWFCVRDSFAIGFADVAA